MNRTAMKKIASIACSVALATALAGCGGDDDGSSDSATLTAEEFLAQADAICKAQDEAEAETLSAAFEASQSGDAAAGQAAVESAVAIIRGEADDIAALKAPEELKDEVDAMVAALNEGLDNLAEQGLAATNVLEDASNKAKALGLKECGN